MKLEQEDAGRCGSGQSDISDLSRKLAELTRRPSLGPEAVFNAQRDVSVSRQKSAEMFSKLAEMGFRTAGSSGVPVRLTIETVTNIMSLVQPLLDRVSYLESIADEDKRVGTALGHIINGLHDRMSVVEAKLEAGSEGQDNDKVENVDVLVENLVDDLFDIAREYVHPSSHAEAIGLAFEKRLRPALEQVLGRTKYWRQEALSARRRLANVQQ